MGDGKHCPNCGRDIGVRSIVLATLPTQIRCPHCGARLAYHNTLPVVVVQAALIVGLTAGCYYLTRAVLSSQGLWRSGGLTAALIAAWGLFWALVVESGAAFFLRRNRTLHLLESAGGLSGRRFAGKAAKGALEGVLIVGLSVGIGIWFAQGRPPAISAVLAGAGFGAIMFAVGRAVTGRLVGAVFGGIAGLLCGAVVGERVIGAYTYETPAAIQQGGEMTIAGPTLQGQPFELKALRGKVVLVDFWATWCGPCVAELPNVRRVYDRYHADGFEVVGVSLDNSRQQLDDYVRQKDIPWPQIIFEDEPSLGWNNPLARRYEITGIPAMFLIDRDGHVVAHDEVRGPGLEPAVARLLGKTAPAGGAADRWTRLEVFPLGLLIGALAGCTGGSLLGALFERLLRRRKPVAPASATK